MLYKTSMKTCFYQKKDHLKQVLGKSQGAKYVRSYMKIEQNTSLIMIISPRTNFSSVSQTLNSCCKETCLNWILLGSPSTTPLHDGPHLKHRLHGPQRQLAFREGQEARHCPDNEMNPRLILSSAPGNCSWFPLCVSRLTPRSYQGPCMKTCSFPLSVTAEFSD